jgi:tRNA(Ile)-lysidine synthase
VALVAAEGIEAVADPSNLDDSFDRARLRKQMAATDWLNIPAIAESAAHLADTEAAILWAAEQEGAKRIKTSNGVTSLDPAGIPDELLRRLTAYVLTTIVPDNPPRGSQLAALVASLKSGEKATLGGVLATPGPVWRFEIAPPRRKI